MRFNHAAEITTGNPFPAFSVLPPFLGRAARSFLLAVILILAGSHAAHSAGKIVFGWATFGDTKWPAPYSGGTVPHDSLPWSVLTHVGLFAANGQTPPQSYYVNQYGAFTARAHQAGVYAGITVGGSGDAALVSMVSGGPASWLAWINHYLTYLDAHRMDFLDFDFEGSYSASNVQGFFSLLYDSLNVPHRYSGLQPTRKPFIVLTCNVPNAINWSSATIRSRVEFVNLMTYDYNNSAWGRVTFDNSPKSYKWYNGTGGATDSVGSGVNAIAPSMQRMAIRVNAGGWPMSKLNVGMDFNGGGWGGATQIRQGLSGTSSGGSSLTFSSSSNGWGIWKDLPADSIFFDQVAQAYWARTNGGIYTWLALPGRDSGVIATRKVVDSMGLGGVCIWNLGNEVWNTSSIPPGGRGWFFSQLRKHFDYGNNPPPPPPPPPDRPKIRGEVFFDADQDGVRDAGEPPVPGWTVTLSGTQSHQQVTDSAGSYSFNTLALGNYTVTLGNKPLWTRTFPASGSGTAAVIDTIDRVVEAHFGVHSPSAFHFPAGRYWNIVSMPVEVPDMSTGFLFPLLVTPAYSFHGSYQTESTLTPGEGYWIKFNQGHEVWVAGTSRITDTVNVNPGWNFVGSVSETIPVEAVTTVPPGLLSPYIYGYEGSSFVTSQIEPGKGYWVHALGAGTVVLNGSGSAEPAAAVERPLPETTLNRITFISPNDIRESIYFTYDADEPASWPAPPSPPGSSFFARFRSAGPGGTAVEAVTDGSSLPVMLTGAAYPLRIEWEMAGGSSGATLRAPGGLEYPLEGTGSLEGIDPGSVGAGAMQFTIGPGGASAATPAEYALQQNYPNPFNGTTLIAFSLPAESDVTIELFNVIGERVSVLIDRRFDAGAHSTSFDGGNLPSGVYLYRLTARDGDDVTRFTSARKLAYIR